MLNSKQLLFSESCHCVCVTSLQSFPFSRCLLSYLKARLRPLTRNRPLLEAAKKPWLSRSPKVERPHGPRHVWPRWLSADSVHVQVGNFNDKILWSPPLMRYGKWIVSRINFVKSRLGSNLSCGTESRRKSPAGRWAANRRRLVWGGANNP